jgi:MSHA biogenesis protein MshO
MNAPLARMRGATLVELVVTIVILGIVAAAASVYLVPAFESYFATQRRSDIADLADTALRRMTRELRLALPNSARVDGAGRFIEILLTKNGGRYRSSNDDNNPVATAEETLHFHDLDAVFDTLGPLASGADQQVAANDYVVIQNLGIAGANAYDIGATLPGATTPNIAQISAFGAGALANENRITLAGAGNKFPLESPGRRFFVVAGPITYACQNVGLDASGNGTGTLDRWSGYAIQYRGGLPPTVLPGGAQSALLASFVSGCDIAYAPLPLQSRGLVSLRLALTRANETVTLYYEAHVNNVP